MVRVLCILLAAQFCLASHASPNEMATWEQTRDTALQKAKAGDYDYIVEHLLAPELIDSMKKQYGAEKWREELQKTKLYNLRYYFGWLKKPKIKTEGNKVFLKGEYGCYAEFIKVDGKYLLLDIGQKITSM